MLTKVKDVSEFVSEMKQSRDYHYKLYKEFDTVISILQGKPDIEDNNSTRTPPKVEPIMKNKPGRKPGATGNFNTFIVAEITKAGKPLSVPELMSIYKKAKGSVPEAKNFGSMLYKTKNAGLINNYQESSFPRDSRNLWGLKEWFDGESINNKYERSSALFT